MINCCSFSIQSFLEMSLHSSWRWWNSLFPSRHRQSFSLNFYFASRSSGKSFTQLATLVIIHRIEHNVAKKIIIIRIISIRLIKYLQNIILFYGEHEICFPWISRRTCAAFLRHKISHRSHQQTRMTAKHGRQYGEFLTLFFPTKPPLMPSIIHIWFPFMETKSTKSFCSCPRSRPFVVVACLMYSSVAK